MQKRKKLFYTFVQSHNEDDKEEMKNNNIYKFSIPHAFQKFVERGYCFFIFVEIPVLRFRRPILPRA